MNGNEKLNILVVGAGMYVCGRGTSGYGTVLPALCEWRRRGLPLGEVFLAATRPESISYARQRLDSLNELMGTDLALRTFPDDEEGRDPESYMLALREISRPACAIVVVPDHLHCKVAGDCLKAGAHTLVVKPLAPTVKEARELISLQEKHGVYGAVEFHKRFDRANLKLKEVLGQEKLGDPLYFIVEFSQRKSVPSKVFESWVKESNIFQYLGVHYVDIIYFATGAVPRRVMALGQTGWLRDHGIDTYDAVHGTIEWEGPNGKTFLSHIFTNWIDPESTSAMSDQRIKVIGTKGRYESDQKRRGIEMVTDETGVEEPNPDFCSTYPGGSGTVSYQGYGIESLLTFIRDVIELNQNRITIEQLESVRPTFRDTLASTAVVESVNKSLAQSGAWVEVVY
ncbi:MAG: Gfo/Idh/MocA family oxidoreductase [Deltaproteobacteria bacterium]|nr:Gfo/Idh/MocA family oxidoreductase [Deltaproteobacteria bacterium]MBW2033858.1 Gfo/Idh/MocA family oxidoreductase [Deltaproteobacteria bacterium]MBW2345392.1 Gfo/Idh/MocA family oxidoreductase [Deltaproteobacteria bacterium]